MAGELASAYTQTYRRTRILPPTEEGNDSEHALDAGQGRFPSRAQGTTPCSAQAAKLRDHGSWLTLIGVSTMQSHTKQTQRPGCKVCGNRGGYLAHDRELALQRGDDCADGYVANGGGVWNSSLAVVAAARASRVVRGRLPLGT